MNHDRRDLAYNSIRVFVGAYREAISQRLVALKWPDAPEKGATVIIELQAPFMDKPVDLIGEISQRTDKGAVVALQPMGSQAAFDLDSHADLCERILGTFDTAIREHITQAADWPGLQIQPCVATVDDSTVGTDGKRGLTQLTVSVDDLMQYLHLHRTHLDNRELFLQMASAPEMRALLHIQLGLPFLGREVELRGVVSKVLSDGVFVDLAPYPRATRRTFSWYWKLVEHAAAEVTAEIAREHGGAAVVAIRALLPKAGPGIADLVKAENEGLDLDEGTDAPDVTSAPPEPPPSADEAGGEQALVTAPPAPAPETDHEAQAPDSPPPEPEALPEMSPPAASTDTSAPDADGAEPGVPSIFARRRAHGGRRGGHTAPSVDAVGTTIESAVAASALNSESETTAAGPVIPVLLGDGSSPPRQERHDTLTSFERSQRGREGGRDALSRMIGRGSADMGATASRRRTGVTATSDVLIPPSLDAIEEPPAPSVPSLATGAAGMDDTHDDISIFKRPQQRVRARTLPNAEAAAATAAQATPAPPVETVSEPAAAEEEAAAASFAPPPPEPIAPPAAPVAPPPPEPVAPPPPEPVAPPAFATPVSASAGAVEEDDLMEDDLSTPLRPPKGSLEDRPLVEILGELYRHTATGALKLKGPKRTITMSLRKGRVCHVAEDPADESSMMGSQFMALGVSKHEVSRAVSESKKSKKLIGQVMLEFGIAIKSQVKQALIQQLKVRMGNIDGYEAAEYEYIDGQGKRREDAPNVDPVKLLFRGRFEYYATRNKRENAVESHSNSGSFVRQRNRGRRWVARFGLTLPQQGIWELTETGELKLSQLYAKLSVDETVVNSTLFALRDFGCIQFRTKKQAEQTREAIEKRFQEKMEVLRTGNQFEVLDVHWTATDKEVQEGHDRCKHSFDPTNIDKPSDLMRKLSREILPALDEACTLLKKKATRVEYRNSIVTEQHIKNAAEHLVEQGDMDLFKSDVRAARDKFRRAIELAPDNKKIKRKLNDTFTISGQAAAQSENKVQHKPAVTLPGADD